MEMELIVNSHAEDGQGWNTRIAAGPASDHVPLDEYRVDDDVEAQGGHGQVMAGQAQGGYAHYQGRETYKSCYDQHGQPRVPSPFGAKDGRAVGP